MPENVEEMGLLTLFICRSGFRQISTSVYNYHDRRLNFMFGRDISIMSYILSAVVTMLFSVSVDLFMIKKMRNIKMVDSMKAND